MHLYTILLVFSILTSRLHPGCSASCTGSFSVSKPTLKIFKKVPYLDDRTVKQETLAAETVKSDVDCGRRCDRVEKCVMFTFLSGPSDKHPGECRMYGQLNESLTDLENSPGARSYRLTDSPKKCDNGYSMMDGLCLRYGDTNMNFFAAKDLCQELDNGHLAIPRTLDDLPIIYTFLPALGWIWLGADDLAEEGKFVWHNGSTVPVDSPLWDNGQPSGGEGVNCMCTAVDRKLHDCTCYKTRYAICQKDLVG